MEAESIAEYAMKVLNEAPVTGRLEDLELKLKKIQNFLNDALWRQVKWEDVWDWIAELEDSAYELEDFVRERRSGNPRRRRRWTLWVSCYIPSISSFLNQALEKREILSLTNKVHDQLRLKLDIERLKVRRKIRAHAQAIRAAYLFQEAGGTSNSDGRFANNRPKPEVFGREKDRSCLLEHLFMYINEYEVVSIVGFGGSGKTTMAGVVFDHSTVKAQFDTRIWVCVSNVFDEKKVAAEILESLGLHRPEEDSSLFQLLETCFSGRRVLLVLDDVWSEDASKWDMFKGLLKNGAPGSRMLVTTRSLRVAKAAGSDYVYHLGQLPKKHCWSIVKSIALSGRHGEKELRRIGKKIAKNCKGSPLVATAIGGILRWKTSVVEWQQVLESEMWEIEEIGMRLFDEFYLSYDELSQEMRSSLSYCAIYPEDAVINVDQLVRLWVAQGFFGYPTQEDDEEIKLDKGMECFHELASRGFFQDLTQDSISIHRNKLTSCKIQGSAHQLVKYLGRHDFTRLASHTPSGSMIFSINSKVRSVVIPPNVPVDADMFGQLKRIRALVLSSRELDELPSEVGELSRLQYMDLSDNPIKELPESICNLYFLDFLDVHLCYLLSSLPQRFAELEQLKHLRVNNTTDQLQILPQGFENLRLIQTMDVFQVGGKFRANVAKLSHLDHLKQVCIVVHGSVDFKDAKLVEKTQMRNLEFSFAWSGRNEEVATSIRKLQPPPNLETLKFEDYPGYKLPRWILTEPLVSKLTRLSLNSALLISSLPGLWRLSSLEFLWLYDIPNLYNLGREFFGLPKPLQQRSNKEQIIYQDDDEEEDDDEDIDSEDSEASDDKLNEVQAYRFHRLKTWRIEHLENLEGWEYVDEFKMELENMPLVMPSLKELIINKCPKLNLSKRFRNLAIMDQDSHL